MPQHQSAKKRVRQSEVRRQRNVAKRSAMKSAIARVKDASDKETAAAEYTKTSSILDRMAVKGLIHKNKAANLKSKLTKHVTGLK